MEGIFYVYLLKSHDGSYYTGITNNINRRLKEHNSGKLKVTSKHKPYSLVYSKEYFSYSEARKHEKWLKKKNCKYKSKLSLLK